MLASYASNLVDEGVRALLQTRRAGPLVPKAPGAGGIAAALRQSASQANPDSYLPTPSNTNTVHMNGSNFRWVPSPGRPGTALSSLLAKAFKAHCRTRMEDEGNGQLFGILYSL